jgi:3-methyl-2-oxobutanoate hydroxymethyltransferase
MPKFVKTYADVWGRSLWGTEEFRSEVKSRAFPSADYTYPVPEEELVELRRLVDSRLINCG